MPERHVSPRPLTFVVVWSGSVMFAASLLWFLYCYLIRFDSLDAARAVPTSRPAAIAVNVLLFSVFALHHSLLARARAKSLVYRLLPRELERSFYTWVASLLFIAICTAWQPVGGTIYTLHGAWRILGYAVQFAGLALTIRASQALDVLDLSGVRPVTLAARGNPAPHVPLETTGLYGFVRHPLYFAWTLFVFGAPDMTATRFVFAATSTIYLSMAIPWEERGLIQTFGPDYEAYRRKVRWRMLPGLY